FKPPKEVLSMLFKISLRPVFGQLIIIYKLEIVNTESAFYNHLFSFKTKNKNSNEVASLMHLNK
ncbi:MAG: hypothetical protein J6573_08655, partial [Lactobacillus sp.]|nr:hypothetical protein [Lactobacillus sp.]